MKTRLFYITRGLSPWQVIYKPEKCCNYELAPMLYNFIVLDSLIRTRLYPLAERWSVSEAELSRIYAEHCRSSRIRPNFYGNDYNLPEV